MGHSPFRFDPHPPAPGIDKDDQVIPMTEPAGKRNQLIGHDPLFAVFLIYLSGGAGNVACDFTVSPVSFSIGG
jgi:hypothetical protein